MYTEEWYQRGHNTPSDDVLAYYTQLVNSIKDNRSTPNNDSLSFMMRNCNNRADVKLLFDLLHILHSFTQSYLDSELCKEVAYTCSFVGGARDFGLKTLLKQNEYGLVPSVECANTLLRRAHSSQDVELMVAVMEQVEANDIPLRSDTADIVCSICYNVDDWELLSMYLTRFVDAKVKIQGSIFDMWMESAAKIGDPETLWESRT